MASAILTQERLKELLHYDPETGIFTRNTTVGGSIKGTKTGSKAANGYLLIRVDRVLHYAHRLAWLYMTGQWPVKFIDHINTIKIDNRFANLRQADKSQNMQNQIKPIKSNTSGFLGVTWHKAARKWAARIQINNLYINLGLFTDPSVAHHAYLEAKRKLHPYSTI